MHRSVVGDSLAAETIDASESLWEASDRISEILGWARIVAAWLLLMPILLFIGLFVPWFLQWAVLFAILGGGYGLLTSVGILTKSRKAVSGLDNWISGMVPFRYTVKFEMFPSKTEDREADILQRYASLYPPIASAKETTGWRRLFKGDRLVIRGSVEGRADEHEFSVFAVSREHDLALFVRRFFGNLPVTLQDLEQLKEDVEDVLEKTDVSDFFVGAFAEGGFGDDAIAYADSDLGVVREEVAMDLIHEVGDEYVVVLV